MYCSVCGAENGDFSARCQACGEPLRRVDTSVGPAGPSGPPLVAALATTAALSSVLLVVLVVLISREDLWPRVLGAATLDSAVAGAVTPAVPVARPTRVFASAAIAPVQPLDVGQIGSSGDWRFVVDSVRTAADDTTSGWLQAIVTATFQNSGSRAARLAIPSTLAGQSSTPRWSQSTPSFLPVPAVAVTGPAAADGLQMDLVDPGGRVFGGGFGPTSGSYELIAAPKDVVRLSYRFRYPGNVGGPVTLRATFPISAGGNVYEVRLDRVASQPARLGVIAGTGRADTASRVDVGGQWAITCQGVDFGPATEAGERPVTVHLLVENLTDHDLPALTDVDDPHGTLRDFYLTDSAGNLAYSHTDDLPGVMVPAHGRRSVMVPLHTLDLPSSARPLYFTAILNWQQNRFAQFLLAEP
jgi:hypothetical protein